MKYDYIIMARPTYATRLTPRFDAFSRSGVIRGTAPIDIRQTAIQSYSITNEDSEYPSLTVLRQYNLAK